MVKLKHLVVATSAVMTITVCVPAYAVPLDRTFNNGATSISVNAQISPRMQKSVANTYYLRDDPTAFDQAQLDLAKGWQIRRGTIEEVLAAKNQQTTDERLRLSGLNNSYINFGINQSLAANNGVFANVGMMHTPNTGMLLAGGATFYQRDLGALMLFTNTPMPTQSVAKTNTYNVLDSGIGSWVAVAYDKIPNVSLQGYYAFADLPDGNPMNTGLRRSYGATADYKHSFAARNDLTLSAGYSQGERRNDLSDNYVARDTQAVMAGVSYDYYDWDIGIDGGVSKSDYHGNILDNATTNAMGLSVGYNITSRLKATAYYGKQDTKSTEAQGVTLDYRTMLGTVAQKNIGVTNERQLVRAIDERQLFKNIKEDTYGVGLRYAYHSNLSFNANMSQNNAKYSLTDGDFVKTKGQNYSLGMTFSF